MSFCKWNVLISKKIANPEIPGLDRRPSRDPGLTKRAGISGFGIPGLETLRVSMAILPVLQWICDAYGF